MTSIPAFCDTCGAVFPSKIVLDGRFRMFGNRSGPCPSCNGMGHTPDGVFNFVGNTIEILSAPERSIQELTHLAQLLREAVAKQRSNEQVSTQLKQELPALSAVAELLPKNRGELYGFLALILATIDLLTASPQPSQHVTVNVSQVVEQTFANTEARTQNSVSSPSPKIGRNKPCPCGSGVKYKRCCGSPK